MPKALGRQLVVNSQLEFNKMKSAKSLANDVGQGWLSEDLRDENWWKIKIPGKVSKELLELASQNRIASVIQQSASVHDVKLTSAKSLLGQVRGALNRFPGFVVLTEFPLVSEELSRIESSYLALGNCLGRPVSQSRKGDLIGKVEDKGNDISIPTVRGYESSAALPFHCDRCDLIGMLCVRKAKEGGLSRMVSSIALHNRIAAHRPDLLRVLYEPFPHDRRGEEMPGEKPWCTMPVFWRSITGLITRYIRRFILGSQRFPDAPRLSTEQLSAMDYIDDLIESPEFRFEITLNEGDLLLINNHVILHGRTSFKDWDEPGQRRLLLRLWLSHPDSPPLPPSFRPIYGNIEAGSFRGGVWPLTT